VWLAALGAGHLSPAGGAASCGLSSGGVDSLGSLAGGGGASWGDTAGGGSGSRGRAGSGDSWCLNGVHIAAFAGIAALGVADAAASTIGLAVGRHRIFRGACCHARGNLVSTSPWATDTCRNSDPHHCAFLFLDFILLFTNT